MLKGKCLKHHYPESICMADRFVQFHNTKFRIALAYHEYYCEECKKQRMKWFVYRG